MARFGPFRESNCRYAFYGSFLNENKVLVRVVNPEDNPKNGRGFHIEWYWREISEYAEPKEGMEECHLERGESCTGPLHLNLLPGHQFEIWARRSPQERYIDKFRPSLDLPPELDIDFDIPKGPFCPGSGIPMRLEFTETSNRIGGIIDVTIGDLTERVILEPRGSQTIKRSFTAPERGSFRKEITIGDARTGGLIDRWSITREMKFPSIDMDLEIPVLEEVSSVCPGREVVGSLVARARNCAQEVRGRIMDTKRGTTIAEFGSTTLDPGESTDTDFSFSMPLNPVSLKGVVERRTDEGWKAVKSRTKDIGFRESRLEVGGIRI